MAIYLFTRLIHFISFLKLTCTICIHYLTSLLVSSRNALQSHSSTEFVHGKITSKLLLDNSNTSSLHAHVLNNVPALFKTYKPATWLPFGDLQTIYSSAFHRSEVPRVTYQRKYIMVPDGGCISVDITPPISSEAPANTPIVLVLHGLLGGSHVSYVRSAVDQITRPVAQGGLGLRVVVFNLRGCSRTPVISPLLYHPGMTDDVRSVVLYTSSMYPDAKLYALGFSLGAGYLTNYLSEEGDASPITAGFAVSNVWDYAGCSLELSHGRFLSRALYNPILGRGHQKIINNNRQAFKSHSRLDKLLDRRFATMSWFTAQFMAHTAGVDPVQFLHDTSCAKSIAGVRVPLLCLNARDDPLLPESYIPFNQVKSSEHVMMVVTERGGHLGWFEDAKDGLDVWYADAIIQYFKAMLQVREHHRAAPRATYCRRTGMAHQSGRPNVGFREVPIEHIRDLANQMRPITEAEKKVETSKLQFYPKRRKYLPTLLHSFLRVCRVSVFPI